MAALALGIFTVLFVVVFVVRSFLQRARTGAVAGTVLTLAAQLDMGDEWRIGVDPAKTTDLVTTGTLSHPPVGYPQYVARVGRFVPWIGRSDAQA